MSLTELESNSSDWMSRERFRQLADAVRRLANARERDAVIEIVRGSARALCGASGVAIVLREDDLCHYIAEDSEVPLWAGQTFSAGHCISGWAMAHGRQTVVEDIYVDPRIPHDAYRPTGVQSLVMTPVGAPRAYAALGAYWTYRHLATADEIASLQAIAECMASALQAIDMRQSLEQRLAESERRRLQREEARREVAFQAHLLDIVQQAVIATDVEGRVIYWNGFAEKLYGWTREEAVGRTVIELKTAPDNAESSAELLRHLQEGGSWTGEILLSRKDGEVFPAWVSDWPIRDAEGRLVGIVGVSVDNTERRRAEDHQRLLVNELNHRVKNTLAIVQSIAAQSLRGAGVAGARSAFEARLLALSDAHNLMVDAGWAPLPLRQVAETALRPFGHSAATDRFEIGGPEILLTPRTAISFTLVLHELATNAVKYGALSTPGGRVAFRWTIAGPGHESFRAEWRESNGPQVSAPARRGFGMRLIEQGLATELGGTIRLDFAPAGVTCRIETKASSVVAPPSASLLFPLPGRAQRRGVRRLRLTPAPAAPGSARPQGFAGSPRHG